MRIRKAFTKWPAALAYLYKSYDCSTYWQRDGLQFRNNYVRDMR